MEETLNSLQPHVIGIRYIDGSAVVDSVFKDGWSLIDDPNIKRIKGDGDMNYYMIYSEVNGVGLDELLGYVERVIALNKEREKKHDLLRQKVNELKVIFKKNSLKQLMKLKFTFPNDELLPDLTDFDVDDEITEEIDSPVQEPIYEEEIIETNQISELPNPQVLEYLDENGKKIELSEEEREMIAEEERAKRNLQLQANKKPISNTAKKVELPPRRKLQTANDMDYDSECDCSESEACEKCIDRKDL